MGDTGLHVHRQLSSARLRGRWRALLLVRASFSGAQVRGRLGRTTNDSRHQAFCGRVGSFAWNASLARREPDRRRKNDSELEFCETRGHVGSEQGCPSTQWSCNGKHHKWADWNGRIQMLVREELRPEEERNADLVASLLAMFKSYSEPEMS